MGKDTTAVGGLTIGLDLGDKHTVGCVLTRSGEVEETFSVATTMSALGRTMAGFESSRVVLEVGTHSPWVSRLVEQAGHEVIIANPRRVRLIAENDSKTDEVDAELRRFGLKLAERGGKAAKKRAAVAVARKLSVLLHRLWVTGEEYQAIGYGQPTQEAA